MSCVRISFIRHVWVLGNWSLFYFIGISMTILLDMVSPRRFERLTPSLGGVSGLEPNLKLVFKFITKLEI